MDTIFMNSENSKMSDPHILLLNLVDKINLKRSHKFVALAFTICGKTWKSHTKIINLKYQLRNGMKSLNYLIYHGLYHIFKITLHTFWKNMSQFLRK